MTSRINSKADRCFNRVVQLRQSRLIDTYLVRESHTSCKRVECGGRLMDKGKVGLGQAA